MLPGALYLDRARLTTQGLMRSRLAGMRLARARRPIVPARPLMWRHAAAEGGGLGLELVAAVCAAR